MTYCSCGRVRVDREVVGRNWNPDCQEHGLDSEWYKTTGKPRFKEENDRAVALQKQAGEARKRARNEDG